MTPPLSTEDVNALSSTAVPDGEATQVQPGAPSIVGQTTTAVPFEPPSDDGLVIDAAPALTRRVVATRPPPERRGLLGRLHTPSHRVAVPTPEHRFAEIEAELAQMAERTRELTEELAGLRSQARLAQTTPTVAELRARGVLPGLPALEPLSEQGLATIASSMSTGEPPVDPVLLPKLPETVDTLPP